MQLGTVVARLWVRDHFARIPTMAHCHVAEHMQSGMTRWLPTRTR
ncbi:MAG TPA: multicopper oxidase domain-containing protein [Actinomycetes bacterium]